MAARKRRGIQPDSENLVIGLLGGYSLICVLLVGVAMLQGQSSPDFFQITGGMSITALAQKLNKPKDKTE